MDRFVYVDNAATTAPHSEVIAEMQKALVDGWGNPSSLHSKGRDAKKLLDDARARVAKCIGASKPEEIYFTSGGTEADNWAIKSATASSGKNHIITSAIEHPAVMRTCDALEKQGFRVTRLGVDKYGKISLDELSAALTSDTALVAIMMANNEIGTIEPIKEAAVLAHKAGALMFTDAVQAVGAIPVNVAELGVDMLSLSGHKIHTPKGIGALYVKRGTRVKPFIDGGGQERGMRSGTENIPYILALAKALEVSLERMPDEARVIAMRDRIIEGLTAIPHTRLNGHPTDRLPGNVNISFEYIEGESLALLADMAGICVSTGSACSSASLEPSHVLLATGLTHELAHGSMRISLCHDNTDEDVDYILEKIPPIVKRLRDMSPLYPGDDK